MMRVAVQLQRQGALLMRRQTGPNSTTVCDRMNSSAALQWEPDDSDKHCASCTCAVGDKKKSKALPGPLPPPAPVLLPPPQPEPKYSVHKRVLPSFLIALNSPPGRQLLKRTLQSEYAESYWPLMEHFQNQSHPAYCGVTSLVMALNAMSVDPQIRWSGGWRYYGNEDVLLGRCCLSSEIVKRVGITMDQFAKLAKCQGVNVETKRVSPTSATTTDSVDQFREDIRDTLSSSHKILVACFSRAALGQTGDGHYSPIAAYCEETDRVLILDVARFKYPPYWAKVTELHLSMLPKDEACNQSRGWFIVDGTHNRDRSEYLVRDEKRRPASIVREFGQPDICPLGVVKVEYCKASAMSSRA